MIFYRLGVMLIVLRKLKTKFVPKTWTDQDAFLALKLLKVNMAYAFSTEIYFEFTTRDWTTWLQTSVYSYEY